MLRNIDSEPLQLQLMLSRLDDRRLRSKLKAARAISPAEVRITDAGSGIPETVTLTVAAPLELKLPLKLTLPFRFPTPFWIVLLDPKTYKYSTLAGRGKNTPKTCDLESV